MKIDKKSLMLYLVTDRSWEGEDTLLEQVEKSLESGVTFLQLREKSMGDEEFLQSAIEMKALAKKYSVPFVINDNVDVAIESEADGLHIGQGDMAAGQARRIIGDDKILGVSVSNVEQALKAQSEGADYLGVGAMFTTSTKKDASNLSVDMLSEICNSVEIPVVAIGGINEGNILGLGGSGIAGVAVVSAILAREDIPGATVNLRKLCEKMVSKEYERRQ